MRKIMRRGYQKRYSYDDKKIFIGLTAITMLLIIALVLVALDYFTVSYKDRIIQAYKQETNSQLSDTEFLEEVIEQNQEQRGQIELLEVELAEKGLLIQRLVGQSSINFSISTIRRIDKEDIRFYDDRIIIYVDKPFGAMFTGSKSMYPFINKYALAIEIEPEQASDIKVGDVIGYESKTLNESIIHRVIETGSDEQGWYAITKGDNNPFPDSEKVRFSDISGLLVGLIY